MKKIILFAANGFTGKSIIDYIEKHQTNDLLVAVCRKFCPDLPAHVTQVLWDGKTKGSWTKHLENADLVINLAGKSVDCRYTSKNKAAILSSRLESTKIIGEAIRNCRQKPSCWINLASATIYEHSIEKGNTETSGIIGSGFSVEVCQAWEKQFFEFKDLPTRQLLIRSAIVLGKQGGVYPVLKKLAKTGLGGKMGPGNQQISWIHIEDFCKALFFLFDNKARGIYNLSSPTPVPNALFQEKLRQSLQIRYYIDQPTWMLQLGAWLLGTETELILKSRFVLPERLLRESFEFKFPHIESCLADLQQVSET